MSSRFSAVDLAVPGSESETTLVAQDDSGAKQTIVFPRLSDAALDSTWVVQSVADGVITLGYISSSELIGPEGDQGVQGEQGEQGEQGSQGPPGIGFTYKQPTAPSAPANGETWLEEVSISGNVTCRSWLRRENQWIEMAALVTNFQRGYSTTGFTVDLACFDMSSVESFVEQLSFKYAALGTINSTNFWVATLQIIRTNSGSVTATVLSTAVLDNGNAGFGSQVIPVEMLPAPVYLSPGYVWVRVVFARSGNPGQLLVSGTVKTRRFR
jgi:hypothetical protein